jgi:hypothetical protein
MDSLHPYKIYATTKDLAIYLTLSEANILASALESADIPYITKEGMASGVFPDMGGGITIAVRPKDFRKAELIKMEVFNSESSEVYSTSNHISFWWILAIFILCAAIVSYRIFSLQEF